MHVCSQHYFKQYINKSSICFFVKILSLRFNITLFLPKICSHFSICKSNIDIYKEDIFKKNLSEKDIKTIELGPVLFYHILVHLKYDIIYALTLSKI